MWKHYNEQLHECILKRLQEFKSITSSGLISIVLNREEEENPVVLKNRR